MNLRMEAIDSWPGELTVARKHSQFDSTYLQTLDVLDKELWHARAVEATVVVQLAVDRSEILRDGSRLKASARPAHPGVIVSFTSHKLGKLRFACDRFFDWHHNLRAIALGMESLRRVDRYGITSDGQQYAGFRALEAAESARGFETIEAAARYIVSHAMPEMPDDRLEGRSEMVLDDEELLDHYFRRAMKFHHPDAGGDATVAALLNTARAMIEEAQK
jgi:hypothetical protein